MAKTNRGNRVRAEDVPVAPHSVEAEEALLGALLMNPDALDEVRGLLVTDDFFIVRNGWVYSAMLHLADRRDAIDTRSLAEELRAAGQLDDCGGEGYLNYLPTVVPTALHAPVYAKLVRRMSIRRQLISAAGQVVSLAWDGELPLEDVIDRAQAAVFAVRGDLERGTVTFSDALSRIWDDLEAERSGEPSALRIALPWRDLNRLVGGIEGKQLIIPAARPGRGKTAMMLQIATAAARQGRSVLICSLEMSERELVSRIIAQETGISTDMQRQMTDDQWRQFLAWVSQRSGELARITFDTSGSLTPLRVAALARDMRRRGQLDLLVVDYLQLMQADRRIDNRNEELSEITRALKRLAMELDIPIVAASQLSRDSMRGGQRPRLHHLLASGSLEANGNMVIFIHDPEPEVEDTDVFGNGPKELIVGKNRNGKTGVVPVVWIGERMMFGDLARAKESGGKSKGGKDDRVSAR